MKKDGEGQEFVTCQLVARDLILRHEGSRDDLCAATPPLEATTVSFAYIARTRRATRSRGDSEVKLMFLGAKYTTARTVRGTQSRWNIRQVEWWLCSVRMATSEWEDDCARKLVSDGYSTCERIVYRHGAILLILRECSGFNPGR